MWHLLSILTNFHVDVDSHVLCFLSPWPRIFVHISFQESCSVIHLVSRWSPAVSSMALNLLRSVEWNETSSLCRLDTAKQPMSKKASSQVQAIV